MSFFSRATGPVAASITLFALLGMSSPSKAWDIARMPVEAAAATVIPAINSSNTVPVPGSALQPATETTPDEVSIATTPAPAAGLNYASLAAAVAAQDMPGTMRFGARMPRQCGLFRIRRVSRCRASSRWPTSSSIAPSRGVFRRRSARWSSSRASSRSCAAAASRRSGRTRNTAPPPRSLRSLWRRAGTIPRPMRCISMRAGSRRAGTVRA